MNKLFVDSWTWLELFLGGNKGSHVKKALLTAPNRYTTSINLFEVLYRLTDDNGKEAAARGLEIIENNSIIVDINSTAATEAVEVRLKEKLPAIDALSLAAARLNGAMFITGDPHFKRVSGVIYIE